MTDIVRIGNATLIHGDCLQLLHALPPVDAVVSDPPYGIGFSLGKGTGTLAGDSKFEGVTIVGDDKPFDPSPWLKFKQAVLFGANHYASRLPDSAFWLVWDKRDGVCSNDQADCELAWVKGRGNVRIVRHVWMGMVKASERGESRVHPTQKPVAVMDWVIRQTTAKGQTILDPYMGSGTTGVACARLGRAFVGIEVERRYFDAACERIAAAHAEPTLFNLDAGVEQDTQEADLFESDHHEGCEISPYVHRDGTLERQCHEDCKHAGTPYPEMRASK